MKKNLILCALIAFTLNATSPSEETITVAENEKTEVAKIHNALTRFKAELVALLSMVLEEIEALEDITTTRSIDFSAWNNLQEDYEKFHGNTQDAEEVEGEQE